MMREDPRQSTERSELQTDPRSKSQKPIKQGSISTLKVTCKRNRCKRLPDKSTKSDKRSDQMEETKDNFQRPSLCPFGKPSNVPSLVLMVLPALDFIVWPGNEPFGRPGFVPILAPGLHPSNTPSDRPWFSPSNLPRIRPFADPSILPSFDPFVEPSNLPRFCPSLAPTV